jgi:hypothetical protein
MPLAQDTELRPFPIRKEDNILDSDINFIHCNIFIALTG